MEYKFNILPEESLVIETVTGEITLEEMVQKTKTLFENPLYEASFSGVADLRKASLRMSKVELYGFATLVNESDQFGQAPWAILADDPMMVALSQVFKLRIQNPHFIGVFSTVVEASRFVQKPTVLEFIDEEAII